MNPKIKKIGIYFFELGKWVVVIWLLYPAINIEVGKYLNPYRFIGGITLFLIFLGKTFYDVFLVKILQNKNKSTKQELFSMLGTIIILTLAIALVIFLVGYLIYTSMGSITMPVEE
ncbi:hypothetical protein ACFL4T_00825 [candidate division KSB1 bacterium]